jgi:hypothetical protein
MEADTHRFPAVTASMCDSIFRYGPAPKGLRGTSPARAGNWFPAIAPVRSSLSSRIRSEACSQLRIDLQIIKLIITNAGNDLWSYSNGFLDF